MFHAGDITSGITTAMQQDKCVVCFLRDDSDESHRWETEYLSDQNIPMALERNAVTLRISSGSQEASFLTAFTPVSTLPALVVIYEGQVKTQINSGISKNDFTLRLLSAINRDGRDALGSSSTTPQQPSTEMSSQHASDSAAPQSSSSHTTPSDRQSRIQSLLAERKQRLDAEKRLRDEAEKRERTERARQRASATEADGSITAQRKHAEMEKKRKLEAQAEKERVRRLVEADKEERRARQERQRALQQEERRASLQGSADVYGSSKPRASGITLQVRLLNGSSIRGSFTPEDTPGGAVRTWIERTRTDSKAPYTLKIILTPLPSKAISESDESKSLRLLGLMPSATLVLVPSRGAVASAYEMSKPGVTLFGPFFTAIFHTLAMIFGLLGRVLNAFIGSGVEAAADNVRRHEGQDAAPGADAIATARAQKRRDHARQDAGVTFRTIRDQHDDHDESREYYNGNQLSFEPKPKKEEEEEEQRR